MQFQTQAAPQVQKNGFTLFEVVVVVAIMAFLSAVTLAGSGSSRHTTRLLNEGYNIASFIRLAQTYGIASRASEGGFNVPTGVFFTSPSRYVQMFVDEDNDGWFNPAKDKVVDTLRLAEGLAIRNVCVWERGGWKCSASAPGEVQGLSVVFKRPDPEAYIQTKVGGKQASIAKVLLTMEGVDKKVAVEVYATGALAVSWD